MLRPVHSRVGTATVNHKFEIISSKFFFARTSKKRMWKTGFTQVHNRAVVTTKIEQRLPAYSSNQSLHFFTENGFVISSLLWLVSLYIKINYEMELNIHDCYIIGAL